MQEYFEYLNKFYDKIYVLSVASFEHRRKLFAERFSGLNYTFFFGADKNKFSIEELIEKGIFSEELTRKHHRYGKTMKPGEIACAWSHKMIYEEMLEKGFQQILIFEDDAIPVAEMMNKIPETLTEVPADCELLMWGWDKNGESNIKAFIKQAGYHILYQIGFLNWNHTIIKNISAKSYSPQLKKAGFHDYTYSYAINKSGAKKLLNMQTPVQYIADNLLAHACTQQIVNGYIVYPAAFLHDSHPDGTSRDSYIR